MTPRHLKSRHGEAGDIDLNFDRKHQRFAPVGGAQCPRPDAAKVKSALAAAWARTLPAGEGDGDDDA